MLQIFIGLAVDDEQNTGDQCANSSNDAQDSTKAYTQKTKSGNHQKDTEQYPF